MNTIKLVESTFKQKKKNSFNETEEGQGSEYFHTRSAAEGTSCFEHQHRVAGRAPSHAKHGEVPRALESGGL